jgi:hypothetical protein
MSAVSESIVRDYVEGLGFIVTQPRKYQVVARAKRADEEIDLLAWNPRAEGEPPAPGVWTGDELRRVRAAVIGIRGWHTERFSPSALTDSPEILRIGGADVLKEAAHPENLRPAARTADGPVSHPSQGIQVARGGSAGGHSPRGAGGMNLELETWNLKLLVLPTPET